MSREKKARLLDDLALLKKDVNNSYMEQNAELSSLRSELDRITAAKRANTQIPAEPIQEVCECAG